MNDGSLTRVHSPKLAGRKGPECTIPKCSGTTISTGWIVLRDGNWWMEFECAEHGPQHAAGSVWTELIIEALKAHGLSDPPVMDYRFRGSGQKGAQE